VALVPVARFLRAHGVGALRAVLEQAGGAPTPPEQLTKEQLVEQLQEARARLETEQARAR